MRSWRIRRADALPLVAALPIVALFAWWIADEGGYFPTEWMPGAVAVLALLGISLAALAGRYRPSRAAVVAIAALGAYTLWSFASILWANAPDAALEGSQRALLYLGCFACFALLPWTPRALLALAVALVFTIAIVGVITLLRVAASQNPIGFFIDARLIPPLDYQNASAALWTTGAMTALVLASRREIAVWLRPVLLGACGLLLGLAVMTQSRGWLFTLPIVLLAVLVLTPGRVRLILFAAVVAGGLVVVLGDLLEPYRSAAALAPADASVRLRVTFDDAARSLLLMSGALTVAGCVAVWIDERLWPRVMPSAVVRRRASAILLGALAAGAVGAGLIATNGDPIERADHGWTEFKDFKKGGIQTNRFVALGSTRYDFWRVGVDAWRAHPIGGLGQDNFADTYTKERQTSFEEPRWVHSLPLRLLVHTGLVGAGLFVAFLLAVGWAVRGAWAGGSARPRMRSAAGVALVPASVWLIHGSVDWLWEYPALSGPALALAGAATALRSRGGPARGARSARRVAGPGRRWRLAVGLVPALIGVALIVPSYVAVRDVQDAATRWPTNPSAAFARLDRARSLNPLNTRASLVEGIIASQLGQLGRARAAFARVARQNPGEWFPRFELGLVAGARGDAGAAEAQLRVAQQLNPHDTLVALALQRARSGSPMTFKTARNELQMRVRRRQGGG